MAARPLPELPALAEQAAQLLRTPSALLQLTMPEAAQVVGRMEVFSYPRGAVLINAGDREPPTYMLLILAGDVAVESGASGAPDSVAISVLGPGSLVGEMALLDGAPRSATCVAASHVVAAGLSREQLLALVEAQPAVAAKFLAGVAQRVAERLRAFGEQIQIYADLAARQRAQIEQLGGGPRRG